MTFWKRQNYDDSQKKLVAGVAVFVRLEEWGWDKQMQQGESLGQWNYFVWYKNGRYVSFYLHSSKPIGHTTQRVSPNVNHGIQFIMYQYWFINSNKCIIIMDNVNSREKPADEQWGNK